MDVKELEQIIKKQQEQIVRKHAMSMLVDKLDDLFENFFDVLLWVNVDGKILYTTQNFCDKLERKFMEVVGHYFFEFLETSDSETHKLWKKMSDEKIVNPEFTNVYLSKSGKKITICWKPNKWFKNHEWTSFVVGSIVDIEE